MSEPRQECQIAEILQFSCKTQLMANGFRQLHCFPIPRLFMLCQGQPAVEITRAVNIDPLTAKVTVPPDVIQRLPMSKQWKDVSRSRS